MPEPKPRRLHSLDPAEVSLVKRGANKRKFAMFKSEDGAPGADLLSQVRTHQLTDEARARIQKAVDDAAVDDNGQARLTDRAQAALKAVARILAPFVDQYDAQDLSGLGEAIGLGQDTEVDSDDDGDLSGDVDGGDGGNNDTDTDTPGDDAQSAAAGTVTDTEDANMADDPKKPDVGDIKMDMSAPAGVADEDHAAAMTSAKKAYMAQLAKKDYNSKAAKPWEKDKAEDDEEEDEMGKGSKVDKSADSTDLGAFPAEQRAQLEAVFKSHRELQEENKVLVQKSADLAKALEVERDHRVSKEMIAKASEFKHLACDRGELAMTFRDFHDRADSEGMERLERVLKAADTQAAQAEKMGGNLFGVAGSSQRGPAKGSVDAQLEALVDSHVAKSDGSKSRQQVYTEVLNSQAGRDLYTQHSAERAASRGN